MYMCDFILCAILLCVRPDSIICVWRDAFICVTWLIHMCDMTHSYVRHDSFICVTWLIHMCDMTHSYVWHDSFICATWLIYVWHDSFIRVTWLIHTCDLSRLRVGGHQVRQFRPFFFRFIRVTWLYYMCDMILSYARDMTWRDSFIRVTLLMCVCDTSYSCVWHDSMPWVAWYILCATWLRYSGDMTRLCVDEKDAHQV